MTDKSLEFFKLANYIGGTALILLGIFGFIPAITPNNHVFGIFMVDGEHNIIHIIIGSIMWIAGLWTNRFTIYLILLIGFAFLGLSMFGFFSQKSIGSFNTADNLLHLGISLFSLFQGWLVSKVSE